MTDVPIGVEVIKLGDIDDDSPWRMTVDVWDGDRGEMVRMQVTGHYNGWPEGPPQRTMEELARVQVGDAEKRLLIARELDQLDRAAAEKIVPIMDELRRAQIRLLYGEDALQLLGAVTHDEHAAHDEATDSPPPTPKGG